MWCCHLKSLTPGSSKEGMPDAQQLCESEYCRRTSKHRAANCHIHGNFMALLVLAQLRGFTVTDSCKEEVVKNCQDTGSELRGMRLQRVTSMTWMKTRNEKTWAERINTEEAGHQLGVRIFFFNYNFKSFPFSFQFETQWLSVIGTCLGYSNKYFRNRGLKCVLAETVGLYRDLKTLVKVKRSFIYLYDCLLYAQSKSVDPKE